MQPARYRLHRFDCQDQWQAPASVQTVPHGQPLPPGAQLAKLAQFAQFPFEHVQL